jgi:hypothetical protein
MIELSRRCTHLFGGLGLLFALQLATLSAHAAPDDATQKGEQLAAQAYELHAAGKEAEAIAAYLKAYEILNAGALLLNVAMIYDRALHERELATNYYRRYVRAPDAEPDLVRKATTRLTALKKESDADTEARNATPVPAPTSTSVAAKTEPRTSGQSGTPAPEPTRDGTLRTMAIVGSVAGVASIGTSLVLGYLAKKKNDDANAVCNGAACATERGVTLARDSGTFATASTVTFIAGAAVLGGGIALFLSATKSNTTSTAPAANGSRTSVTPAFGMGSAGVTFQGSF